MRQNGLVGRSPLLTNVGKWAQHISRSLTHPVLNAKAMATLTKFHNTYLGHDFPSREAKPLSIALSILNWRYLTHLVLGITRERIFLCLVAAIFAAAFWWPNWEVASSINMSDADDGIALPDEELQPRIFECRTTHRRLFPTQHSFSYTYLFVGIPVGWHGSGGRVLSSDPPTDSPKTWFSVHAGDYLERGHHPDGLAGKLEDYLKTQDVSANAYPYAYLITAPRFCGFSFNPVSFWYLYDNKMRLRAMILEVNNTFDERRMYFLHKDENEVTPITPRFHSKWDKDFHVSPFNDRDGSYSLTAIDPLSDSSSRLDNTIVLNSPEGKPKLIARIFSTKKGIDPRCMSTFQTYLFLARWWWVGFMTNPRILREARTLWVKKLQLFYRPEVLRSSIGRAEMPEETKLEPYFRMLLCRLSRLSGKAISYVPAAGEDRGQAVVLQEGDQPDSRYAAIDIKVGTPAFYAELVRGEDLLRTLDRFCFSPAQGEAMVFVSECDTLRQAVESLQQSRPTFNNTAQGQLASINLDLRSSGSLLSISLEAVRNLFTTGTAARTFANKLARLSFDTFVHQEFSTADLAIYERTCFKVLLADRLALGFTSLLMLYVRVAWLGALLAWAAHISGLLRGSRNLGIQDAVVLVVKLVMASCLRSLLG